MKILKTQWSLLRAYWRESYGREVRTGAVSFLLLIFIGVGIGLAFPQLLDQVMDWFLNLFGEMDVWDDAGKISIAALFINNARACALSVLYGVVPFVYLSALPMGINALLLGAVAAYYMGTGTSLLLYTVALLPHGIFEIPALILSFSLGIDLCSRITRRFRHDAEAPALGTVLSQAARVFLLTILPLLAIAAVVEARVTPALLSLFS